MKKIRVCFFILIAAVLVTLGIQSIINWNHMNLMGKNQYAPYEIIHDSRDFSLEKGSLFRIPEIPKDETPTKDQEVYYAYRYAKLLQEKYPEYLTNEQAEFLKNVGSDDEQLPLTRLYALTSLKLANRESDEQLAKKIAQDLMSSFPSNISIDELSNYIQVAEVAYDADPFIQKSTLNEYPVSPDEERLTVAVLTYFYLFDNEDEVKKMFPDIQKKIREFSLEDSENMTVDQYLLSSAALIVTQGTNYEEISKLREKDSKLSKCGASGTFIAMDVNGNKVCSLLLTEIYYQRGVWQWSQ